MRFAASLVTVVCIASPALANIGTTLRQLGRNPEAADIGYKYLASADVDPKRLVEVRAALAETEAKSGKLEIVSQGKRRCGKSTSRVST